MTQIWDFQRREWESSSVAKSQWRLRPIIPIVFYTGEQRWQTPLTLNAVMDLPDVLSGFVPNPASEKQFQAEQAKEKQAILASLESEMLEKQNALIRQAVRANLELLEQTGAKITSNFIRERLMVVLIEDNEQR